VADHLTAATSGHFFSPRRITGRLDDRKNTRPSVSEIVVELLIRHRDELDAMD
jgi:hypothetical protein